MSVVLFQSYFQILYIREVNALIKHIEPQGKGYGMTPKHTLTYQFMV